LTGETLAEGLVHGVEAFSLVLARKASAGLNSSLLFHVILIALAHHLIEFDSHLSILLPVDAHVSDRGREQVFGFLELAALTVASDTLRKFLSKTYLNDL
jgi:hypothetical protein